MAVDMRIPAVPKAGKIALVEGGDIDLHSREGTIVVRTKQRRVEHGATIALETCCLRREKGSYYQDAKTRYTLI